LSEHVANAQPRSHAIECRINAEDPDNNFQPSPGMIDLYYAPGGRGVRVDSHVYSKYTIPPYYDSMIAKLICVGSTRGSAIRRMSRALNEYLITGIKTTIPFQIEIMRHADFVRGDFDTSFVEKMSTPKPFEMQ
ncbi:MAG TPA: acetyl-CoA carboxylase biotin carboxylase subunit, partial [Candidatus Udaeobacter sp.]|nr:acetyl-CoA carboxylase biotin carboxylase subunit [Candidatus Udaeobacter sp.]